MSLDVTLIVSRLLTLVRGSEFASQTAFVYLLKRLVELCCVPRLEGSEGDVMLGRGCYWLTGKWPALSSHSHIRYVFVGGRLFSMSAGFRGCTHACRVVRRWIPIQSIGIPSV